MPPFRQGYYVLPSVALGSVRISPASRRTSTYRSRDAGEMIFVTRTSLIQKSPEVSF
jgi:hypothetical protein